MNDYSRSQKMSFNSAKERNGDLGKWTARISRIDEKNSQKKLTTANRVS